MSRQFMLTIRGDIYHVTIVNPDFIRMQRGEPIFIGSGVSGRKDVGEPIEYEIVNNKTVVLRGRHQDGLFKTDAHYYDYNKASDGERDFDKLKSLQIPHYIDFDSINGDTREEKIINLLRTFGTLSEC